MSLPSSEWFAELNPRRTFGSYCQNCQGIYSNFTRLFYVEDDPQYFDHYEDFLSLQASADQGCLLCQSIWQNIVWECQMSEPFQNLRLKEWHLDSGCINIMLETDCPSSNIFPAVEFPPEMLPDGFVMEPNSSRSLLINLSEFPQEYLQEVKPISIKRSMPGPENKDLKELIQTEIWPWIRNCQSQHVNCTELDATVAPTRLIDVGLDGAEMVKLVQTDQKAQKALEYLALSYCWGGSGNNKARTTWANLQSRLNGIWVKDLPRTIQDAITVTRLMRINYLWVDAICIIQPDGPNDRGDWDTEAGRMGDYYAGCLCCIAATCAESSTEGFLRPRPFGRYKLQPVPVPFTEPNGQGDCAFVLILPYLDGITWSTRKRKDPLMDRGWCLQERILSRRVLHWTWAGLFKECRSMRPRLEGDDLKELELERALTRPHILSLGKREALGQGWCQLVYHYSNMTLSYASDRMVAISGVANLLSRKHQDDYFYGAFRSSLAECLLWWSSAEPRTPCEYPSWSWLSFTRDIGFPTLMLATTRRELDARQSLVRQVLPNPFPKSHGLTNPGSRLEQAIEVEAPLIELELAEKTVPFHSQVKIPDTSRLFAGWDCLYQGTPLEGKAHGSGGVVDVLLLLGGREYNGLVLKRKSEKEWERTGVITMRSDDETAVQCVDGFIRKVVLA